jgi:hypothetical protein
VDELRRRWQARDPKGNVLGIEYDRLRQRWRVTPGGYEARTLGRALSQATGDPATTPWIAELVKTLDAPREA